MSCYQEKLFKIKEALCSGEVADAAAVSPANWAAYHIFEGIGEGFIKGRNRGRLPFVEITDQDTDWAQAAVDGQYENSNWIIRINVKGRDPGELRQNAQRIARAFLNLFKQDIQERSGTVSLGSLVTTPWGGYCDLTMVFEDVDSDYDYNDVEF